MKPLIFLSGPFGTFMSGNAKLDITHRTLQVTIAAERSRLARKIQYLTEAVGLMYVHVIAWFDCKLRTELLVEILHIRDERTSIELSVVKRNATVGTGTTQKAVPSDPKERRPLSFPPHPCGHRMRKLHLLTSLIQLPYGSRT